MDYIPVSYNVTSSFPINAMTSAAYRYQFLRVSAVYVGLASVGYIKG